MRIAGGIVGLGLLVLGAPAWSGEGDTDEPGLPEAFQPKPTQVPYRSTVSGVPVVGVRKPPQPPPRVYRGPGWLARTLNIEDPPDRTPRAEVPSGDIAEPEITARSLPEPRPRPTALREDEIIVYGDRLELARARVTNRLTDMGYAPAGLKNGRQVWKPTSAQDSWKPRVIIDDDGWFELDTPAVSGMRGDLSESAMQPGPTAEAPAFQYAPPMATPGVGGQFAGKRVRQAAEARVARQIWDVVRDLAKAHQDEALIRTLEGLPDELDALWYEGRAPDGTWYADARARKEALLLLWATRTRTRAGETVRRRIGDYLIHVVDAESSLPADLVEQAEARCGCALFEVVPGQGDGPTE